MNDITALALLVSKAKASVFTMEYISNDGKSFVLTYKDETDQPSRCYSDHDIRRSFRKVAA